MKFFGTALLVCFMSQASFAKVDAKKEAVKPTQKRTVDASWEALSKEKSDKAFEKLFEASGKIMVNVKCDLDDQNMKLSELLVKSFMNRINQFQATKRFYNDCFFENPKANRKTAKCMMSFDAEGGGEEPTARIYNYEVILDNAENPVSVGKVSCNFGA